MTSRIPTHCRDGCGLALVPGCPGARPAGLPPGQAPHGGRGLAATCYDRHKKAGDLHLYGRQTSRAQIAAGWAIAAQLGWRRAEFAALLDMTVPTLDRAISYGNKHDAPPTPAARVTPIRDARRAQWSHPDLFDLDTRDEGEAS